MSRAVISVFADGGVCGRNPSLVGGVWHWVHLDEEDAVVMEGGGSCRPAAIGLPTVSNNVTEMLAVVEALEGLPEGWFGDVYSDSQITLGRLFFGWRWKGIPTAIYRRAGTVLRRVDAPNIRPHLLDGHPTAAQLAAKIGKRGHGCHKMNVYCDKRCQDAARAMLLAHKEQNDGI